VAFWEHFSDIRPRLSWRSSKDRRSQSEEPDDDDALFGSKRTYLEQNDQYPPPIDMIAIRPKRSASSCG
jgi:hypothetical protein